MFERAQPKENVHLKFATLFGLIGGLMLLAILDAEENTAGAGSYAAIAMGVTWPLLALARRRWEADPNSRRRTRWFHVAAVVAMLTSAVSSVIAVLFAIAHGLTIDLPAMPAGTRPVRGAWMIWLFPLICLFFTIVSFLVAKRDVQVAKRQLTVPDLHG